jgi:hypothetical protein
MASRNHNLDPDGQRLPIKLDSTSNGEFFPRPLSVATRYANKLARESIGHAAKRLNLKRRNFLKSLCGAASTLLAINAAYAKAGMTGGGYVLPQEATFELAAAQVAIGGDEFIFDVQTHHVNPKGAWRRLTNQWTYILRAFPQSHCGDNAIDCFSADHFLREIFLDSDTDMAVLSAVPAAPEDNPLSTEEAAATRKLTESLGDGRRLLIHGLVHPNLSGSLDAMVRQKEQHGIVAWKTYTGWGPQGTGYWLDDPRTGIPFIEKARELGVKIVCVHKGFPLFRQTYEYSTCRDIGVVAKRYPDVRFIVYHSGYDPDKQEGPYDPAKTQSGVDMLIKSLQDNGIAPNGNVYAELGSTWRSVMQDPDQAAHLLGKLLKFVGSDNVLWGTDSIWYGSPQDQIQALRAFQIAEPLREKYGYPELSKALKAKIFGLNAAVPYALAPEELRKRHRADAVGKAKQAYLEDPDPSFLTYGPKNRREFLSLYQLNGGRP